MKLKFFVFILLLSSVSAFAQTKDETALKTLVKDFTDAQMNFRPEALDKMLTADYIEISPIGEFDPRAKMLGFYKPELKPPADKMSMTLEIDEYSIRSYKDFAVVIARLNYQMTVDGKTMPRQMRATLVCRKEKSAWKIASVQYTGIRPPAAAPKSE